MRIAEIMVNSLCPNQAAKKKWMIGGGIATVLIVIIIVIAVTTTSQSASDDDSNFTSRDVLTTYPLIDAHNRFPDYLYNKYRYDLSAFDMNQTLPGTSTDLPRLRRGMVRGQYWAAWVPCESSAKDAVARTFDQIDAIKRFVQLHHQDFQLAYSVQDIRNAIRDKRIASMLSIEGGHSIDSRFSVLRSFYNEGVRYMTLTHGCHTPWAESHLADDDMTQRSAAGPGLTAWGKMVVLEMNRLGMVVDLTHTARQTMLDAIAISKAPVIYSHSSSYTRHMLSSNVPDDILHMLKATNGVVMINFAKFFLAATNASIEHVVEHIEHIRNVTGSVDYIGMGGDYDGTIAGMPPGLEDVSTYPALFDRLIERGWSRSDLGQIASGNLLRVFAEAEKVRDQMANVRPADMVIDKTDLLKFQGADTCRSDYVVGVDKIMYPRRAMRP